jgi:DNA topoisomerase III
MMFLVLCFRRVRASIEQAIGQIALGNAKFEDVVRNSIETFRKKFDYFVANINLMDELFEASFSKLTDMEVNTRMKPKCGDCNRYMKYINLKCVDVICAIWDSPFLTESIAFSPQAAPFVLLYL